MEIKPCIVCKAKPGTWLLEFKVVGQSGESPGEVLDNGYCDDCINLQVKMSLTPPPAAGGTE